MNEKNEDSGFSSGLDTTQESLDTTREDTCPSIKCFGCHLEFKTKLNLTNHKCKLKVLPPNLVPDFTVPSKQCQEILKKGLVGNTSQVAQICAGTTSTLPGHFPILFQPRGAIIPILEKIGVVGEEAVKKLKEHVTEAGFIQIPTTISIRLEDTIVQLGEEVILPKRKISGIQITRYENYYTAILVKNTTEHSQDKTTDDGQESDSSKHSDCFNKDDYESSNEDSDDEEYIQNHLQVID